MPGLGLGSAPEPGAQFYQNRAGRMNSPRGIRGSCRQQAGDVGWPQSTRVRCTFHPKTCLWQGGWSGRGGGAVAPVVLGDRARGRVCWQLYLTRELRERNCRALMCVSPTASSPSGPLSVRPAFISRHRSRHRRGRCGPSGQDPASSPAQRPQQGLGLGVSCRALSQVPAGLSRPPEETRFLLTTFAALPVVTGLTGQVPGWLLGSPARCGRARLVLEGRA